MIILSKNIIIDEEVWAELQRRAQPFEETTPNAVLRRLLDLKGKTARVHDANDNGLDSRIAKLQDLVGGLGGQRPSVRPTKSGNFGIPSESGKIFGHIYPQKKRLKVEVRKDWAERVGLKNWDHELPNAWFNTGISSVYWYIPNGDEFAYQRVVRIIARLRRSDG